MPQQQSNSSIQDAIKKLWKNFVYIITSPYRIFKFVCFTLGFLTLCTLLGASVSLYSFYTSLPKLEKMNFETLKKIAQEKLNKKTETKNHTWTEFKDINRDFIFAIVMSEDAGFYEHNGINYDALIDSLAENIKRREYAFGASTITQQVVKNTFLTSDKSLVRKLKEILITRNLERNFTKNQILEVYLNTIEFGPDIYGISQASAHFFKKHPNKVNAAEAAYMALMLPSPRRNYYSLYQNHNLTKQKQRHLRRILAGMVSEEYISFKQYQDYLKYPFFKDSSSYQSKRFPAHFKK